MAMTVFGNPINDETLKAMPKYVGKGISRLDRAREAMNMKNPEGAGKDVNALKYVQNLKKDCGGEVSTQCLIYNATGDPLSYVTMLKEIGHVGSAPYPILIENGQWGAFLHVGPCTKSTALDMLSHFSFLMPVPVLLLSSAGIVYRGKNNAGDEIDWMCFWSISKHLGGLISSKDNPNQARTLIREAGFMEGNDVSGEMKSLRDEFKDCVSMVSIGEGRSPVFEAIFTLKGADQPNPPNF